MDRLMHQCPTMLNTNKVKSEDESKSGKISTVFVTLGCVIDNMCDQPLGVTWHTTHQDCLCDNMCDQSLVRVDYCMSRNLLGLESGASFCL